MVPFYLDGRISQFQASFGVNRFWNHIRKTSRSTTMQGRVTEGTRVGTEQEGLPGQCQSQPGFELCGGHQLEPGVLSEGAGSAPSLLKC